MNGFPPDYTRRRSPLAFLLEGAFAAFIYWLILYLVGLRHYPVMIWPAVTVSRTIALILAQDAGFGYFARLIVAMVALWLPLGLYGLLT